MLERDVAGKHQQADYFPFVKLLNQKPKKE